MKPTVSVLCASVLLAALPASAQALKPGLWEMQTKIASANPETMQAMAMAQKQMANMPPEQRKMMEQMMAKNGMSMNLAEGGGVAMKFCMTKEMAEKQELQSGQEGDCKTTRTPVPGGLNIAFKCSKPPSSGNGQVIFNGNTGYSMRMNVESGGAKPQNMSVEGSGRWLAADCGAVKAK
jgi:hypothetical protein